MTLALNECLLNHQENKKLVLTKNRSNRIFQQVSILSFMMIVSLKHQPSSWTRLCTALPVECILDGYSSHSLCMGFNDYIIQQENPDPELGRDHKIELYSVK